MIPRLSRNEVIEMLYNYPEQSKFEWKQDVNILNENKKSEMAKDVIAIANAHGTSDGYILYGVDPREKDPIKGITISLDDATIQQIVNSKIDRPIDFIYYDMEIDGKKIGLIKINNNQKRPYIVKVDYGKLEKNTIPIRRGSSTDFATEDDLQNMYSDPKRIENIHTRVTALRETIHKEGAISYIINEYLEIMKLIGDKSEIEWSTLELKGIPIEKGKKNFEYRIVNGYISHEDIVDPGIYNLEQIRIIHPEIFSEFKNLIGNPILVLEKLKVSNKSNYIIMNIPGKLLREQGVDLQVTGNDTFFFYVSPNEITRILISIRQRILDRLISL